MPVGGSTASIIAPIASVVQPLLVCAGPCERLDQLELRRPRVQGEPRREAGRATAVLGLLVVVGAERPAAPGSGVERGGEPFERLVEVPDHERDLEYRASDEGLYRDHHSPNISRRGRSPSALAYVDARS